VKECKPLPTGFNLVVSYYALGRAVQVDPIKPTVKPPGTKRLKPGP
jgi:hypothetical protein